MKIDVVSVGRSKVHAITMQRTALTKLIGGFFNGSWWESLADQHLDHCSMVHYGPNCEQSRLIESN